MASLLLLLYPLLILTVMMFISSMATGTIFTMFFMLDMVSVTEGSSTAVPFVWILALLVLWFGVSSPLVFVGSYFGFKKEAMSVPVRTNQIAR